MPDEAVRKDLIVEYTRRMNAGDVDRVLELFTEDARMEDPVGSPAKVGRAELREHLATAIANNVRETPGTSVAAQDGRHAACPVTVRMNFLPAGAVLARYGVLRAPADPHRRHLNINAVLLVGVNPDGLIDELRASWGLTDVSVD